MIIDAAQGLDKAKTRINLKPAKCFTLALLAGSALSMPGAVMAQTWDGSASTDYNTATNWNTNAVPTASGSVSIDIQTNAPVITAGQTGRGGSISVGAFGTGVLTIQPGGALVLGSAGNGGHLAVGHTPSGDGTGGDGTVRATGAGATISGPGGMALSIAATLNSTGLVEILNGAVLSSTSGTLGTGAGSNGTLTISGTGSRWDITSGAGGVRIGSTASNTARGTLNVLNGATVTYPGGVAWSINGGSAINVSGAGSSVRSATFNLTGGNLSVSSGGLVELDQLQLVGSATQPTTLSVAGASSRLTANNFFSTNSPHVISISAGGKLFTNQAGLSQGSIAVTGAGSVWEFAATSNNDTNFGFAAPVTFNVLDGGKINSLNPFKMQIGGGSNVRIAGAGSAIELAGTITIGGTNNSQPAGSFVIEDGGSLIVHNLYGAGLGFSQRGEVIIRTGGSWILDGGRDAGLSINAANLLIDGGTFSAGGIVAYDQGTSNTVLSLRNANFTARELDAAKLVQIGGGVGDPAGRAGIFDVGVVLFRGGRQLVLNHTEQNYVIGSQFRGDPTAQISHLAGDTIFTGTNGGYSGEFNITGGSVRFNGSFGNTVARATLNGAGGQARLGGSGYFGGAVSVVNGTLAPGNSPGTLSIGQDLVLGPNAVLDFELGAPGGTAGLDSDLIVVAGNLTLDGTLNVTDVGGFGAGLYRLFNYAGTLTDNGLNLGTAPTGFTAADLTIQTSVARQVNLLVASPVANFNLWNGPSTTSNGLVSGGAGTWRADRANWTIADGSRNGIADPTQLLIFSGTAGTVTVDTAAGAVRAGAGLQFATGGYRVEGGTVTLDGSVATLRVGDGSSAGTGMTATVASVLTGTARLDKTDLGTLVLAGANTYTGGSRVLGGVLQIASDSALGAAAGTVTLDGATLRTTAALTSTRNVALAAGGGTLDSGTNALTLSGSISGTGNLVFSGSGVRTFSGNSDAFAGRTTLAGGTLLVNGQLGSTVHSLAVSGGATLGGSGRINGIVTLADATLAAGNSPGNLTFGNNLLLGAGSILAFELGAPGGTPGVTSDLITVNGNLTLDGTLNVTDAGGFGPGLYRLFNYSGALTDNGLLLGSLPTGINPLDLEVQTATANQVNLLVGTPITSFTFWDGANSSINNVVDGGAGTWRADTTNWTIANGRRNGVADPSQLLIFAGTAGTVTVDNAGGAVRAGAGLQFAAGGYRVEGGTVTLDGPVATLRVGDGTAVGSGMTATVASVLAGTARLDKTDLGTLVLTGTNTYAGGTRVLGGVLQVAGDGALGAAAGSLTLDGGTLRTTAALTSARNLVVGPGGGALDNGANTFTLSGSLSGTGALSVAGSGLRTFSGNSSGFTGATTLTTGTLDLPGTLGGGLTVAAPALLTGAGRAGSLDLAGTFSPGAASGATGTFNVSGNLTIRAGSTLRVDLTASGATDRIEAGGRALIEGGTVAVTALDPDLTYTNGAVYRIVNAVGGRTGTFAGLTESSAFLDFSLGYDPTGAFLTTTVIAQFPDVAKTENQIRVAAALKDLTRVAGTDSLAVYNAILLLGADPACAAFDAASGEIYPALLAARQRAGLELAGRLAVRGRAPGADGLSFWGGALADRGHVDGDGNGARSTTRGTGLESGIDYRAAGSSWAFGLGGGWQDGQVAVSGRASQANTDAWHIGGYARYGSGALGFSATASAVYADTKAQVTRQIVIGSLARTAASSVKLTTTALHAEARFGWGSDKLAVGPLASLEHVSTRLGPVAESGAAALNLAGGARRESWSRYGIGGFARFGSAGGFADLAVRYVSRERGDTNLNLALAGSPTSFAARTAGGSRGALRVDLRSEAAIGERWSISANLGATQAAREGQIDGNIRLSYRF